MRHAGGGNGGRGKQNLKKGRNDDRVEIAELSGDAAGAVSAESGDAHLPAGKNGGKRCPDAGEVSGGGDGGGRKRGGMETGYVRGGCRRAGTGGGRR